jgi:hypothetical protein
MATVDELVTIIGLELSPATMAKVKAFTEGVDRATSAALKLTITVTASATALGYWLNNLGKSAEHLLHLSEMTGVSTDAIQGLDYAITQLGGSASGLESDLMGIRKGLTALPGEMTPLMEFMARWGGMKDGKIMIRGVGEAIEFLASRFHRMSMGERLKWADRIGISQDTMRLLMEGREGIRKLKQQFEESGGLVPKEALENSIKFEKGLRTIWAAIKGIRDTIGLEFMPNITRLVEKWRDWIRDNRELIHLKVKEFIDGVSEAWSRFTTKIDQIWQAMRPYIDAIMKALGLTGDLKSKTEQFVNIALWGLGLLAALWMAQHAKILVVVGVVGLLGKAIGDIVGTKTTNDLRDYFYYIGLAAAMAADQINRMIAVIASIPAFGMRLASYGVYATGKVGKWAESFKSKEQKQEEGEYADDWINWGNALGVQSDTMQEGIMGAFSGADSYATRFIREFSNLAPPSDANAVPATVNTTNNVTINQNVNTNNPRLLDAESRRSLSGFFGRGARNTHSVNGK